MANGETKNVLIVGGTGTIGSGIAKSLLVKGYNVIVASPNEDKYRAVFGDKIDRCHFLKLDVTENENIIAEIISNAFARFGEIGTLIYAAGVHSNASFYKVDAECFDNALGVNLKGCFFTCQKFCLELERHSYQGKIIIINSISAYNPSLLPGQISKWGVRGLIAGMGQFNKDIIKVYGIAPHMIGDGVEMGTTALEYVVLKTIDIIEDRGALNSGETILLGE